MKLFDDPHNVGSVHTNFPSRSSPTCGVKVSATTGIMTNFVGNASITGQHYTGDGGPAAKATLFMPSGLAFDAAGNLFISDSGNYVVRKVSVCLLLTSSYPYVVFRTLPSILSPTLIRTLYPGRSTLSQALSQLLPATTQLMSGMGVTVVPRPSPPSMVQMASRSMRPGTSSLLIAATGLCAGEKRVAIKPPYVLAFTMHTR